MNDNLTVEKQIIKEVLTELNIPYYTINDRVYIYFKEKISGRTIEINLNLKKRYYSTGICTSPNIYINEHKVLNKLFERLGWL